MAKNKRTASPKEEPTSAAPENAAPSHDELESRYQSRDQASSKDENDSDDERYMTRSRSRKDDRPTGMWGYKNWEPKKEDTTQDPSTTDKEKDRPLNKSTEDDPTSI